MFRFLALLCCLWPGSQAVSTGHLRGPAVEGREGSLRQLSKSESADLLESALSVFHEAHNAKKLQDAAMLAKSEKDPMAKMMALMSNVMPLAVSMMHETLQKYGFTDADALQVIGQIQKHAEGDSKMTNELATLQNALQGTVA
mmetsp:Transcript_61852/g.171429  ORF Transcript_61852/g.171429 Transcript_61852/m.171429 type:complete len:143 (-) Transcript_61852:71-499(-)